MKQRTSRAAATSPIPSPSNNGIFDRATLELLRNWRIHDATNDPEELRAAEEEISAFKKAMNENRIAAGDPLLYP